MAQGQPDQLSEPLPQTKEVKRGWGVCFIMNHLPGMYKGTGFNLFYLKPNQPTKQNWKHVPSQAVGFQEASLSPLKSLSLPPDRSGCEDTRHQVLQLSCLYKESGERRDVREGLQGAQERGSDVTTL